MQAIPLPKIIGLLLLLTMAGHEAAGQLVSIPLGSPAYPILDRYQIKTGLQDVSHPELRPFTRSDAVRCVTEVLSQDPEAASAYDLSYLKAEIACGPQDSVRITRKSPSFFGLFFRSPGNFFEVNTKDFLLRVNPMLHLGAGRETADGDFILTNQRGFDVWGELDKRIYFHTNVLETQVQFPNYVNQWIADYQSVPQAGFYKPYESDLLNVRNGYDFNLANAYVGVQLTRHFNVELGHGRHFIGNGYRSLFLSDVGNYTFYLKFSTRVWRLHYQNLFLELSPISTAVPRPPNSLLPKKYMAAHYLSFQVNPNLSFGFFEATVFNRSRQFELQYLNPVILYRTIEGMIGSPDNVLIGLSGRWNFLRRFQVYGQALIDEFLLSAVFKPEEKGWWGNKFGWQAGVKYLDALGVKTLDLQLEYNTVRPYTYSSFDSLNSYTHYHQPLAHPLWSNFNEFVATARFQPLRRLLLNGRFLLAQYGENRPDQNWGANPLLSNETRMGDYGQFTGQGVDGKTALVGLEASWQLYHNIYADLSVFWRKKDSEDDSRDRLTRSISLGLRWNVWPSHYDF